jgi:hypothetical protein
LQGWQPCSVKRIIVAKPKEVKTGSTLAESSKEGCGSTNAALPMMIMMNLHSVLITGMFRIFWGEVKFYDIKFHGNPSSSCQAVSCIQMDRVNFIGALQGCEYT